MAATLKVTTMMPDADWICLRAAQCEGQHWFYVIFANPNAKTRAGEELLKNLKLLHLDSGNACNYFMAGYVPPEKLAYQRMELELAAELTGKPLPEPMVDLGRERRMAFSDEAFVEIFKTFEKSTKRMWRYSGECELLMFRLMEKTAGVPELDTEEFFAYNLDDIVRNGRTVSEFLRSITIAAEDGLSKEETKRRIDERYSELIMPLPSAMNCEFAQLCGQRFQATDYAAAPYWFISYSTRDFVLVKGLRDRLEAAGQRCWMAPFSIPPGTNYAYMIEMAIKHAERFVLILSRDAVNSIWVGKELLRAISRFQQEHPEKLRVFWSNGSFGLDDTPLAFLLNDVQIAGDLQGREENYVLLLKEAAHK